MEIVRARNENMEGTLHYAMLGTGDVGVVRFLLAHGADPRWKSNKGAAPLDYIRGASFYRTATIADTSGFSLHFPHRKFVLF